MPTLRNTLASMKLAKMPVKGAEWPTAKSSAQTVSASSKTMASE